MNERMFLQIATGVKSFVTSWAGERTHIGVGKHVNLKSGPKKTY